MKKISSIVLRAKFFFPFSAKREIDWFDCSVIWFSFLIRTSISVSNSPSLSLFTRHKSFRIQKKNNFRLAAFEGDSWWAKKCNNRFTLCEWDFLINQFNSRLESFQRSIWTRWQQSRVSAAIPRESVSTSCVSANGEGRNQLIKF